MMIIFTKCDIPLSDRQAHEFCKKWSVLHYLIIAGSNNNSTSSGNAFNDLYVADLMYKECLDNPPFGGSIFNPIDNLLWHECERCYK